MSPEEEELYDVLVDWLKRPLVEVAATLRATVSGAEATALFAPYLGLLAPIAL